LVVDVAAFTGVAFFFEPVVVVSASPLDSSSSSCVRYWKENEVIYLINKTK
jgi:hypothetical protein